MVTYKYGRWLTTESIAEFDLVRNPLDSVVFSGIYRCSTCGQGLALSAPGPLPPRDHHQHADGQPITTWQLLARADF
jgi:hypothetical protein